MNSVLTQLTPAEMRVLAADDKTDTVSFPMDDAQGVCWESKERCQNVIRTVLASPKFQEMVAHEYAKQTGTILPVLVSVLGSMPDIDVMRRYIDKKHRIMEIDALLMGGVVDYHEVARRAEAALMLYPEDPDISYLVGYIDGGVTMALTEDEKRSLQRIAKPEDNRDEIRPIDSSSDGGNLHDGLLAEIRDKMVSALRSDSVMPTEV